MCAPEKFVQACLMLKLVLFLNGILGRKENLTGEHVSQIGFYSNEIMTFMAPSNTCGKSIDNRNSIKFNLCTT